MRSLKSSEAWACSDIASNKCVLRSTALPIQPSMRPFLLRACRYGIRWINGIILALLLIFISKSLPAYAEAIYVEQASLEAENDGGWNLNAHFAFEIKGALEEALLKGIPLYFTVDFKLTRRRWYWLNERTLNISRSRRISYQPLTREYRLSSGGLQRRFTTLDEVLSALQHLSTWRVIPPNTVKTDEPYTAALRMRLDTALMPKPFQIDAMNNRDWNLASDWTYFTFIARSYARAR